MHLTKLDITSTLLNHTYIQIFLTSFQKSFFGTKTYHELKLCYRGEEWAEISVLPRFWGPYPGAMAKLRTWSWRTHWGRLLLELSPGSPCTAESRRDSGSKGHNQTGRSQVQTADTEHLGTGAAASLGRVEVWWSAAYNLSQLQGYNLH